MARRTATPVGTPRDADAQRIGAASPSTRSDELGEKGQEATPSKQKGVPQDCVLQWCRLLAYASVVTSCACAAVCVGSIFTAVPGPASQPRAATPFVEREVAALGVRAMAAAFCTLAAAASLDYRCAKLLLPLLDYWVGRGALQIVAAILMLGASLQDEAVHSSFGVTMASHILLASGALHIAGGLFCFGVIQRWRQGRLEKRDSVIRELASMEARRRELEALV